MKFRQSGRSKMARVTSGAGAASTTRGLVGSALGLGTGRRTGRPDFSRVLPQAMAELVARGLFAADPGADGGYRITEAGRAELARLEGGGGKP